MGYCMIQWLCGRLPWEDKLQDPLYVRDSKLRCRDDVDEFLKSCFPAKNIPEEMKKFMQEVKALGYTDKPDYAKLRGILQQGLKTIGVSDDKKLDFGMSTNGADQPSVKTPKRKKAEEKGQPADETDGAPAKKRRAPQKKDMNGAKKTASPSKRPVKKEAQASSEPAVKKSRGRPKKNS